MLDRTTLYPLYRWVSLALLLALYGLRVWLMQGWYIVTYGLGIYMLNLFIGFITPQVREARSAARAGGARSLLALSLQQALAPCVCLTSLPPLSPTLSARPSLYLPLMLIICASAGPASSTADGPRD